MRPEMDWESVSPKPFVCFELDFAHGLVDRGEHVAQWLKQAEASLLRPILDRFEWEGDPEESDWGTEWGESGGLHVSVSAFSKRGGRLAIHRYRPEKVERLMGKLRTATLRDVTFKAYRLDGSGRPAGESVKLRVGLESVEYPGRADVFRASATRSLLGPGFTEGHQQAWVDLAISVASSLEATTGYITLDRGGGHNHSPYEKVVGVPFGDGLKHGKEWLRGYYWGNFLGPPHVVKLGGMRSVLKGTPVYRAEELPGGGCYLQLTQSLDEFSDEALLELRAFLAPVLPRGRPGHRYIGPPLRVPERS